MGIPDDAAGPQLGSPDRTPFAATAVELPTGSVLVFSSAAPPAPDACGGPSPWGEALAQNDRPLPELVDEVLYRLPGRTMLLLARTHPFPADSVATWQFAQDPTAVSVARQHVRDQLAHWNVDEDTATGTELIVSELVTNGVRYGSPPLDLRLIKDRVLTCEVTDSSPAAPHLRHARTVDEGGRGLFIISQLTQDWGVRYQTVGKTVWAEQPLPPP
jgi:anti-sigma regulatory factor (Ser/Thr protein kinase)